ncbi:MAG: hypothetical protein D6759_16860 [Chloroflexi bacterium]|nr:MAG: hypothetical protein D6759_16860 [Chloroflexota bacterium]
MGQVAQRRPIDKVKIGILYNEETAMATGLELPSTPGCDTIERCNFPVSGTYSPMDTETSSSVVGPVDQAGQELARSRPRE